MREPIAVVEHDRIADLDGRYRRLHAAALAVRRLNGCVERQVDVDGDDTSAASTRAARVAQTVGRTGGQRQRKRHARDGAPAEPAHFPTFGCNDRAAWTISPLKPVDASMVFWSFPSAPRT